MSVSFLVLLSFPVVTAAISFLGLLITGKQVVNEIVFRMAEVGCMVILPLLYVNLCLGAENICFGKDIIAFSAKEKSVIIALTILCFTIYYYCSFRSGIARPLIEVMINLVLIAGIGLCVFIALRIKEPFVVLPGILPVVLMGVMVMIKNRCLFREHEETAINESQPVIEKIAGNLLRGDPKLILVLSFFLLFIYMVMIFI